MFRAITDKSLVFVTRFSSQGVRILSTIVLARLITREDFGRYELIMALPGVFSAIGDFGIARVVATSKDLPDDDVKDTSLVMLLIVAVIFGIMVLCSAFYFDWARNDPRLRWVGLLIAASFLIQNAQAAQLAFLARELKFVRWAGVEAVSMLAAVGTGVTIAALGGGIFALPTQQLLAQSAGLALTLPAQPLRWPRQFSRDVFYRCCSFGWRISLWSLVMNLQTALARLIIGRRDGDGGVGLYGRACQARDFIGYNLNTTFDLILMPLMARAKDQPDRLRDLLLRGSIGVTAFCSFGAAWLAATGPDVTRLILGRNWPEVPSLLLALAPGLVFQGITLPNMILCLALGDPLMMFRASLLGLGALGGAAIAYLSNDLWHFALTLSLLSALPTAYTLWWSSRTTGLRLRILVGRQVPVVLIAAASFGIMWAVRSLIKPESSTLLISGFRLAAATLSGLLIGWLLFYFVDRKSFIDLKSMILRAEAAPAEPSDAIDPIAEQSRG